LIDASSLAASTLRAAGGASRGGGLSCAALDSLPPVHPLLSAAERRQLIISTPARARVVIADK